MMRSPVLLIVLLSLFLWGCEKRESFFFIQISDPQLGFSESNRSIDCELDNLDKAISYINNTKPAFVIVTGDIVNDKKSDRQYDAYIRHISAIDQSIPVYHIPGNHDISAPYVSTLATYRARFGDDHFSFQHGNMSFIGINTSIILDKEDSLSNIQYKWLEKELAEAKSDSAIIFVHCPLFIESIDEKDEYFNFPKSERKKYLNLFSKNRVSTVLAGHLHHNADVHYNNIRMITTGPISKGLGKGKPGLAVCNIDIGGHFSYNYILLDSLAK